MSRRSRWGSARRARSASTCRFADRSATRILVIFVTALIFGSSGPLLRVAAQDPVEDATSSAAGVTPAVPPTPARDETAETTSSAAPADLEIDSADEALDQLRALLASDELDPAARDRLDRVRTAYEAGSFRNAPAALEIPSLIVAIEARTARGSAARTELRDAERRRMARAVEGPSRALTVSAIAAGVVGGISFGTGAYLSGEGLRLADEARDESDPGQRADLESLSDDRLRQAMVPLVGGSILIAGSATLATFAIATEREPTSAPGAPQLDNRTIDELLARRAALREAFSREMLRQDRYRTVGRASLVVAAAGAAFAGGAIVLGQDAYAQYAQASFQEDAEALREGIQRLELAGLAGIGVAFGGLTTWSWSAIRRDEPRRILDEIRTIDAVLAQR